MTIRISAMLALLLITSVSSARDMIVVMHTRDALVVNYLCMNTAERAFCNMPIVRSVVRQPGYVSWHVVGGVAPYTVIESGGMFDQGVCVTVVDALGNVATGCGSYRTQVETITVTCPGVDVNPEAFVTGPDAIAKCTERVHLGVATYRDVPRASDARPMPPSGTRTKSGTVGAGGTDRPLYRGPSTKEPSPPVRTWTARQATGK